MEVLGDRARLRTDDSDATVIALAGLGAIRNLEVSPASLDDAFLAITAGDDAAQGSGSPARPHDGTPLPPHTPETV